MNIYSLIDLIECPRCGGAALLEEENGWCWYVVCADCGAQTIQFDYKTPEGRLKAGQDAARIWNMGKVVSRSPGE